MMKRILLAISSIAVVTALFAVASWGDGERTLTPSAGAQSGVPPVTNIGICSGPDPGQVVVSWDSVPQAAYYRIGYVNMVKDYPRAKASATGEWIEAFVYVDVNARNITVTGGRGQYILHRLVQGDRHAFTVLTSNDVVNTREIISGAYSWPQNPRWAFHTVTNPDPACSAATGGPSPTPEPTQAPTPTPTTPMPAGTVNFSSLEGAQYLEQHHPQEATAIKALPWVSDGLDEEGYSSSTPFVGGSWSGISEREAAEALIVVARQYPNVFNTLLQTPWIQREMTSGVGYAISQTQRVASYSPPLAETILRKPWMQDEITSFDEGLVFLLFANIVTPWGGASQQQIVETAFRILEMPFLDTVESTDIAPLYSLSELKQDKGSVGYLEFVQHPTINDGITDEEAMLVFLLSNDHLSDALLPKPWVQDGINTVEASAITHLSALVRNYPELVVKLTRMPFLDSVESADTQALSTLALLGSYTGQSYLSEVMAHPTLSDGITNQEAKIVVLLHDVYGRDPSLMHILLDPNSTNIEERSTYLPLSGKVDLAIIRTAPGAAHSMDLLERSVHFVEEFMGVPLPTNFVALWFDNSASAHPPGTWSGHITMNSKYDVIDNDSYARFAAEIMAHEVSHSYWHGGIRAWVNEGAASFMDTASENARVGAPIIDYQGVVGHADSIAELDREGGYALSDSAYYLGHQLFLDLYHSLGRETFKHSFRGFYLKSQHDDPTDGCKSTLLSICHLEAAFKTDVSAEVVAKVDEIIDRWYYGIDTFDLDTRVVNPTLPSLNGRIDAAYVTIGGYGAPVTEFSAQSMDDWVALTLEYSYGVSADSRNLLLNIVERFEDGSVTRRHWRALSAADGSGTGTSSFSIGKPPSKPRAPGRYWVYVYDGDRKVAEVEYEVTP